MNLSPEQEERIVKDATRELVHALITNHGSRVYLSAFEAGGLLNWSPVTVKKHLPQYDSTGNGGAIRFLLSDIQAELNKRKIR